MRRLASLLGVAALCAWGPAPAAAQVDGHDNTHDPGSLLNTAQEVIGAGEYWNDGWTGAGVDVAVIDTGVAPVQGLTGRKLVQGPDLSFDSQADNLRYLDGYGHGTHLAGIIAGRDADADLELEKGDSEHFLGVAPGARIVSLKVGEAHGSVDVSQVIAAVDWVTQNRRAGDLNIRVLNLSFGTDSDQLYTSDPLAHAVEQAWRSGIVVVAAAGNGGSGAALDDPAYNPWVIAAGAVDGRGTYTASDDVIPAWSSRGDGTRNPDVVAPGRSIASLRVPGSVIDREHPEGRVAGRFFRGSGTSQAAAFVSGAAALVVDQRPSISPDGVKALLRRTAAPLTGVSSSAQGTGMLNLKRARDTPTPTALQAFAPSKGVGLLEGARGSTHVSASGVELRGERDILGAPWRGATWAAESAARMSWSGGRWNGTTWTGGGFVDGRWAGAEWTGDDWSGEPWSGTQSSSSIWSRIRWSGDGWSRIRWSGDDWTRIRWSSVEWAP